MIIVIFQKVRYEYGMHTALCLGIEPFQLTSYIGGRMEFRGSLVHRRFLNEYAIFLHHFFLEKMHDACMHDAYAILLCV